MACKPQQPDDALIGPDEVLIGNVIVPIADLGRTGSAGPTITRRVDGKVLKATVVENGDGTYSATIDPKEL